MLDELSFVANRFMRQSVKQATLKTYDRYWVIWCQYIMKKFRGIVDPTLHHLPHQTKVFIIINYMAALYDYGYRGEKILRIMGGIKQSMLFQHGCIQCFNDPRVIQCRKSCRFTTDEIKAHILKQKDTTQLPINLDMVDHLREKLWVPGLWDKLATQNKAIYLAIALSFDTGRRIGHFTHRDKSDAEDHCLRVSHVAYTFTPCGRKLACGDRFRDHYCRLGYTHANITTVELLFLTQKQKYVNNIAAPMVVVIDRSSARASELVNMLVDWTIRNCSKDDDEFLTCMVKGSRKVLLQKNVRSELKKAAVSIGIDPKRIGNNSLRRGYATVAELNGSFDHSARARAGWCAHSTVPYRHYIMRTTHQGGLSQVKQVQSRALRSKKI